MYGNRIQNSNEKTTLNQLGSGSATRGQVERKYIILGGTDKPKEQDVETGSDEKIVKVDQHRPYFTTQTKKGQIERNNTRSDLSGKLATNKDIKVSKFSLSGNKSQHIQPNANPFQFSPR